MRLRFNIHYKIILILTFTVVVILSGIYFYLNKNLREYTYQRIKASLSKEADLAKLHLESVFSKNLSLKETRALAANFSASCAPGAKFGGE